MNKMTMLPGQGAFPTFADGNLLIILSGSRQYQLHTSLLRPLSSRINSLCEVEGGAKLSKKAIKRGAVIRYRMLMTPGRDQREDSPSSSSSTVQGPCVPFELKTIPLDDDGKPNIPFFSGLDLENGRVVSPTILVSLSRRS